MKFNRLTRMQDLERRVHHLEQLLAAQGATAITIEQAIRAYFREYHAGAAPDVVAFSRRRFSLEFKPTSVSAILCKLVRLGVVKKHRRNHMAFHSYTMKSKRT